MFRKILGTITFASAAMSAATNLSAHEGANISHFVSQTDHTLAIMVTIGLVGFAATIWRQKNKKNA